MIDDGWRRVWTEMTDEELEGRTPRALTAAIDE
jgi:hypothetical protein